MADSKYVDDFPPVPPTEPAEQKPKRTRRKPKSNGAQILKPDDLRPDMSVGPATSQYWFHIGICIETAPADIYRTTVGGQAFPRHTGALIDARGAGSMGKTLQPDVYLGDLLKLSVDQVQIIAKGLRSHIWRPVIGISGKPGYLWLRIPSPEELENHRRSGRAYLPLTIQEDDVPASHWLYMVLIDEEQPRKPITGDQCPRPISETGIQLPGKTTHRAAPNVLPILRPDHVVGDLGPRGSAVTATGSAKG